MLDLNKIKLLKRLGYILLVVIAVMVGVGIGQTVSTPSRQTQKTKKTEPSTVKLTQEHVKKFLLSYYTKKDLGENRNRYKEYMTAALYQQVTAEEEEPTNQTYKGFVVDFEFKSAEIYIDEDNLQVIALVTYTNTQLDEKKNYDTAQQATNQTTLRLNYVEEDGQMQVNRMESIILTDQTGDYGSLDSSEEAGETADESSEN